jgi:hypothetical protein
MKMDEERIVDDLTHYFFRVDLLLLFPLWASAWTFLHMYITSDPRHTTTQYYTGRQKVFMQASASAPSGGGRGLLSKKKKKHSSPGGLPNQGSTQTQNPTTAEGGAQAQAHAQTRTQAAAPGEVFPSRHLDVPVLYELQVKPLCPCVCLCASYRSYFI